MYILGKFLFGSVGGGGKGKSRDDGGIEFSPLQEGGRELSLCYSFMLSLQHCASGILK